MTTIAQSSLPSIGSSLLEQGYSFAGLRALTEAGAERQSSAELSIVTTEGDRVTLSANSGSLATYERYDSRGRLEDGETTRSGQFREFSSQNEFRITVEGDLNEAELADIRRILEVQGELFSSFLKGEISDEVSEVLDLDKLGTIAKVDATLDISQRVDVFQRVEVSGSGKEISNDEHQHGERNGLITFKGVDKLIDKLLKTVEKYADDPGKLARKLPKLISKFFRKISNEHGEGSQKQRLGQVISSRIQEALGGLVTGPNSGDVPNPSPNALPAESEAYVAEHGHENGQDSIQITIERNFSFEFNAHFSFSLERAPAEPEVNEPPALPSGTSSDTTITPADVTGAESPTFETAPIRSSVTTEAPSAGAILAKAAEPVAADTTPSLSTLLGRLQNTSAASIGAAVRADAVTELLSSLSAPQRPTAPIGEFSNIFDRLQQNNAAPFDRPSVSFFA